MYTTNLTHEPAIYLIQSGKMGSGRPTLGAWVVYGLGSENQNLPAYVVLDDPRGLPINGVEKLGRRASCRRCSRGRAFVRPGSPVLNLRPEVDRPTEVVRAERDLLVRLDERHRRERPRPTQPRRPHRQLRTGGADAAGGDRRPRRLPGESSDSGDVRRGA